ncbi:MAG: DEAD/DEAH box helicase [Deltaproteobacteria bacterium]|nr:DEAD/DEAH box helicase [Deltaproteobacteria bacterium]
MEQLILVAGAHKAHRRNWSRKRKSKDNLIETDISQNPALDFMLDRVALSHNDQGYVFTPLSPVAEGIVFYLGIGDTIPERDAVTNLDKYIEMLKELNLKIVISDSVHRKYNRLKKKYAIKGFPLQVVIPAEDAVSFMNKATGRSLTPLSDSRTQIEDMVNLARWQGKWGGLDSFRKHNTIPDKIKSLYEAYLGRINSLSIPAYDYHAHDAAMAAVSRSAILGHKAGLGKTRIAVLLSEVLGGNSLVCCLPRLVRKVWLREFKALGRGDRCVVLERPKHTDKKVFVDSVKFKGKDPNSKKFKGYKGLGIVRNKTLPFREEHTTCDPNHYAPVKITAFTQLIKGKETLDRVKCGKCGNVYNGDRCDGMYAEVLYFGRPASSPFYARHYKSLGILYDRFRKTGDENSLAGKVNDLYVKTKQARGSDVDQEKVSVRIVPCNSARSMAVCPNCNSRVEIIQYLAEKGEDKKRVWVYKKPAYYLATRKVKRYKSGIFTGNYCKNCNYSARTWVPPITRRLRKQRLNTVFVDESQKIKNPNSQRGRAVTSIDAAHRYLLSATIATNRVVSDVYSQLKWLINDKLFFPFRSFEEFEKEFGRGRSIGVKNLEYFYKLLDPWQIRRNNDSYMVEKNVVLPPIVEKRLKVALSDKERGLYDRMKDDFANWLQERLNRGEAEITKDDVMTQTWTLRKAASCGHLLDSRIKTPAKLSTLSDLVRGFVRNGRKVLIGSCMVETVDSIKEMLDDVPIEKLHGGVDKHEQDRILSLFQEECPDCILPLDPDCPSCGFKPDKIPQVIACTRGVISEGVTLSKASVVIFVDSSWTYADHYQFYKRANRIGANYEKLDVIYLEAEDTIDTYMYNLAESKKADISLAIDRVRVEKTEAVDWMKFAMDIAGWSADRSIGEAVNER